MTDDRAEGRVWGELGNEYLVFGPKGTIYLFDKNPFPMFSSTKAWAASRASSEQDDDGFTLTPIAAAIGKENPNDR